VSYLEMELPDFDYLKLLASDDPDELERLRRFYCEKLIESAPDRYRNRLKGLQFQVDMIKRKSKNPLHSCMQISKLMMDNYVDMQQAIKGVDCANVVSSDRVHHENNIIYLND